jgi:hypothetical protein
VTSLWLSPAKKLRSRGVVVAQIVSVPKRQLFFSSYYEPPTPSSIPPMPNLTMNNQAAHLPAHAPYQEGDIGDVRSRPPVALYDASPMIQVPPLQPVPVQSSYDAASTSKWQPTRGFMQGFKSKKKISKKWQRRLYWYAPAIPVI